MNIFGHIIKDDQITGIGVLTWKEQGQGPVYVSYHFDLFTAVGIKTITSKVIEAYGHIEQQDQVTLKDFRVTYWATRKKVCELLGEPDQESSTILQELKSSYDHLHEEYTNLSTELESSLRRSKSRNVIMSRMQCLETHINQIKMLASA